MSFLTQWKEAKTKFEATTKSKKPSSKFLIVFRKGASIETALKALDSSKSRKDAVKAVTQFDEAAGTYCEKLTKEASNPSSVPKVDKEIYIAAIQKLEKSLQKIRVEGKNLAESLEVTADKTGVDGKALQAAEVHLTMQRKTLDKLGKAVEELGKHEATLQMYEKGAAAALKRYLNPSQASQASINSMAVARFFDEGEKLRMGTCKKLKEAAIKGVTAEAQQAVSDIAAVKSSKQPVPDRTVKEGKKLVTDITAALKAVEDKYADIQKLSGSLLNMKEEATPVDREMLHQAEEHVKLRTRMTTEVTQWAKDAAKDVATMNQLLIEARQLHAQAKTAQTYNNKTELNKIEQDSRGVYQRGDTLAKKVETSVTERTKGGSDLMAARGDNKTAFDALPPRLRDPLKKQRGEAFTKLDVAQRAWAVQTAKVASTFVSLGSFVEQIEGLNGKVKPPSEYISRLQPLEQDLDTKRKAIGDRTVKAQGLVGTTIPAHIKSAKEGDPAKMLAALEKHYELFTQAGEKTLEARQTAEIAASRAEAVPSTDPAVVKLVQAVKKLSEGLIKAADNYASEAKKTDKVFQDAFSEIRSLI